MADNLNAPNTIIVDAEMTATFLRALLEREIPMPAAITLSSTYLQTHILARIGSQKPKEPWEEA